MDVSLVRPARRRPQQRRIVEESDEDVSSPHQPDGSEEEEDFTPAPVPPKRRVARTSNVSSTTRHTAPARQRKARTILDAASDMIQSDAVETLATAKVAQPARKSVRASRKSVIPIIKEEPTIGLPSPTPSVEPEAVPTTSMPLKEISDKKLNGRLVTVSADVAYDIEKPVFEKPMDMVIRARAKPLPEADLVPGPGSRIVLTYLILINFKSYAGRQEIGPFHSSFSSVVGPNGSGKSNVIDSLLFVFGFRASKMRQGKLSALIHNSAGFPDLNHCEVEVHFQEVVDQPNGTSQVVSDSSLVISRKAFKNNSSKYYINGSESNFTTVTGLLREKGVDLDHKRFLILQGEVESIAQMKPKAVSEHDDGLLEYLEDIIGTSKYKPVIEEFAAQADSLNDVCLEKSQRVQHVEKEKKALEGKKNETLSSIKDENELTLKQSALYQLYIAECEDNIQTTGEAAASLHSQLEAGTARHHGSEDGLNALKKQHATESKQFDRLEQSLQTLLKQIAKLDKDAVKFDEKKKHLSAKVKKLEKSKSASHASALEANAHLERLAEDHVRNSESILQLETRLQVEEKELNTIREKLQAKTQTISDEISHKQKSLAPWMQQINEKRSAIALVESELAILKERDQAGSQATLDIQQRLTRVRESKAGKSEELQECQAEHKSTSKQIVALSDDAKKLAEAEPDMRSKLSTARQNVDEARASLAASQTQGNVLTGLMRLKESGRVQGFHGRLGNLGTIDQKYDVAISTACPALDNLVVDSVEVGHTCIEHLRKNNLGRANFILLDRLNIRNLDSIETPENIPRLFDLVKSKDEKFRPAFYSVLQNTLVARDLEQANRVAYGAQRWRVVTLDGQLIDKSGTMSGGGSAKAKGKMSSKLVVEISKPQVEKLEAAQSALERDFHGLQDDRQSLEAKLDGLTSRLPQVDLQIQRHGLELESLDREIADLERRQVELKSANKSDISDAKAVSLLEAKIARLEADIEPLQKNTAGIEEEISTLQERIMEIGGVQLRGQKAKVDGIREQIRTINEELSGSELTKAKIGQQKRKHEKAEVDANSELSSALTDTETLEADVSKHVQEEGSIRANAEEMQEQLDAERESLGAISAQLEEKTAELIEMRGVELDLRNRIEESQRHMNESQKRLRYWQDKSEKLNLHSLSDLGEDLPEPSLTSYTRDELNDLRQDSLKGEIAILEEKLQDVTIDFGVLAEYRQRVEEFSARSNDLAEAVASRDSARKQCEELRRLRLEGFMEGFSTISLRLKEMYQMITMGGNAELELVDSLDPFSEGILFSVMPPKKSWKNISNLSGGEKTLSSLALVFALHHYKPTPLYVMDEIDAALDFRNVSIVASYIKERTKNAQFVVISLRNNMFELASRLVGVYKVNHMTKSVTIENQDYINRPA